MKKKVLFLFVILTMMCSSSANASTLIMQGIIKVITDVDNDFHDAEVRLIRDNGTYILTLYCPSLNAGGDNEYSTINSSQMEYYCIEVCDIHNANYPSAPQLYFAGFQNYTWFEQI